MRNYLVLLASTVLLISSGCAKEFNREHKSHIRTIGIIENENPPTYICDDVAYRTRMGPSTQAGAIPAATDALLRPALSDLMGVPKIEDRIRALTETIEEGNYDFSKEFYQTIKTELEQAGYNTVTIKVNRKNERSFLKDYSDFNSPADAYLDTVFWGVGCCEIPKTGQILVLEMLYYPSVSIQVQLVDAASNNAVLYMQRLSYGRSLDFFKRFEPDGIYSWESFEDLTSDPNGLTEGLRKAIQTLASEIGNDLE